MAKKRVRRRVRRRKKARSSGKVYRRRKARRNMGPEENPRRRRRSRRARARGPRRRRRPASRNPLYRKRDGEFSGRRTKRRLHIRRRGRKRGTWHNPPKAYRRRQRRGYRRAAGRGRGHAYGRRSFRLLDNPLTGIIDTVKEAFSGDTIETVFHTALGFGGTLIASRLIYKQLITGLGESAIGRVGTTLGTSILESAVLGMVGGRQLGVRALAGGLLAVLWQGLSEVIKDTPAAEWIPTLGEGESEEFRKAIEQEVLRELRGGGGGGGMQGYEQDEEGMSYYLSPAGSSEYIPAAGSEAYLTAGEAEGAEAAPHGMMGTDGNNGMGAYLTSREVVAAEAGVGQGENEFGPAGMPERF